MRLGNNEGSAAMVIIKFLEPLKMDGFGSTVVYSSVACGVEKNRSTSFFGVTAHATRAVLKWNLSGKKSSFF